MKRFIKLLPVVIAAATALALAWVITPEQVLEPWYFRSWQQNELNRAIGRAIILRDSARVYRAAWELADTRERAAREPRAPVGLTVRADANVPTSAREAFEARARDEFSRVAPDAHYPVIVRLLVDTTVFRAYSRATVIPVDSTAPCIVQLRLAPRAGRPSRPDNSDQLLGVCGLYARFGAPGAGMTKWLTTTVLATAARHSAEPMVPAFTRRELDSRMAGLGDPYALACIVGRLEFCEQRFDGSERFESRWVGYNPNRLLGPRQLTSALRIAVHPLTEGVNGTGERLARFGASLGDDRFAMIWRSADPPAVAFAQRDGAPLGEYLRQAWTPAGAPYRPGNPARGFGLLVVVVLVAGCVVTAVRLSPRELRL
jgi:hypothetical protein